jgi:predicted TIM-barrel fold metal-dependent hydrolase
MLDHLGFERGVLVQPAAYKTDCRALLHALDLAPGRLRGVALIGPDVSDHELRELHRRGVRAARFSESPPNLPPTGVPFEVLEEFAPRLARLGWHAQIFAACERLPALVKRLSPLGLPLVIDHMGYFNPGQGIDAVNFQSLLRLLETNDLWLKLTAYRLSSAYPDYPDIEPFHRALLAARPERLLWGSDWPHVHMTRDMPDIGHLIDLFERWTPDATLRRRILVDNPATLYGFQ